MPASNQPAKTAYSSSLKGDLHKASHSSLVVQKAVSEHKALEPNNKEFTEIFSWGNDKSGQLGLGQRLSQGKQMHAVPRFCSYNIPIQQVACGQSHSVFITSK
jgi:alpha-tubulin suppressor-like RCC1 family protein